MRSLAISTLIFAAASLVGPALSWVTWPPTKLDEDASALGGTLVSDLLFLIWPTQSLAVIEVNTGSLLAALVAVGANVLMFTVLGVLAGGLVQRRFGLLLLYLATGCLLVLFALWGAGFSVAYLNVTALAIGLLLYAVPFFLTAHLVG